MIIISKVNLDKISRHYRQYELVDYYVKESGKRFLAKRVRLRNGRFTRFGQRFFRLKVDLNNLVKKSVRVDSDMYNALHTIARDDEAFLSKIINSAVIDEISTEQIDLIDAKWFKHKITVYFTQEEYRRVQDVLNKLKNRKIKGVTFSSLVRSVLYKSLGLVQKFKHNIKLIEDIA